MHKTYCQYGIYPFSCTGIYKITAILLTETSKDTKKHHLLSMYRERKRKFIGRSKAWQEEFTYTIHDSYQKHPDQFRD